MKHTIEKHNASLKYLRSICLDLGKVRSALVCLNLTGIKTRDSKRIESEIKKILKTSLKMFSNTIKRYHKEYPNGTDFRNDNAITWPGIHLVEQLSNDTTYLSQEDTLLTKEDKFRKEQQKNWLNVVRD